MGMRHKRGFMFSLDAFIASTLLVLGLIMMSNMFIDEQRTTYLGHLSEDLTRALSTLKVSELNDPYLEMLISNGTITNTNNSIMEQIGEFWAKNQTEYAVYLARNLTDGLVPKTIGYGIFAGGDELYSRNTTLEGLLVSSRNMVSGIEKGKPVLGATAQAYLVAIRQKQTSSYAYFGGFVGQGNITRWINDIPLDANFTEMTMELDAGSAFDLNINGAHCNSFNPSAVYMQTDQWNISACLGSINPGSNNKFEIIFSGELNESYVGGGYIRVKYRTQKLRSDVNSGDSKYYFPGIDGLINIYSSLYVPGTLTGMNAYLNVTSNFSTRLNIGGVDILTIPANSTNTTFFIPNSTLAGLLNYSDLQLKTIPIRYGSLNISYYVSSQGNADVILITDLSGSMAWQLNNNNGGVSRNCDDSQINNSDTRRISLAKCIDSEFVNRIVENPGNLVGLVGYDGTSDDWEGNGIKVSHELSEDNVSLLDQIDNQYNTGGGTCICCAIERATEMLSQTKIELIAQGSEWKYNSSYQFSSPPVDGNGYSWTQIGYDDSLWGIGNAPLGFGGVTTPIKDMHIIDMWDMSDDLPQPVDFTSGVNETGNSFGPGLGNDGWDWQESTYGVGGHPPRDLCKLRDGDPNNGPNLNTHDGSDRLEVDIYGDNDENKDSGAFGIQIWISQEMIDTLNAGGDAVVSFEYEAFDSAYILGGHDETEESVWIKARFGNSSQMHWLGYDLDTGNGAHWAPTDATNEILYDRGTVDNVFWHEDNVYGDFDMDGDGIRNSGTFSQNVTSYISTKGWYYFDVGAIFDCTTGSEGKKEGIIAYFDNFNFVITNTSGDFYLRKEFEIDNPATLTNISLEVYSDDNATIYINGVLIDEDPEEHTANYWNRIINVSNTVLNAGTNIITAKLSNDDAESAKFDVRMTAGDASRNQYIIVMTDGIAGYSCGPIHSECSGNAGDCNNAACQPAMDDAILAAQLAHDNYGITVHSIGFGPVETCSNANYTLRNIAAAGNGTYFASDNATELQSIYGHLAEDILTATRYSQTYSVIGNFSNSHLHSDSYIQYQYEPMVTPATFGEITLQVQTPQFNNCTPDVLIYPNTRVLDAKITSYSAEHWTDLVTLNGTTVFNLSDYGDEYPELGDPYTVQIPANMLSSGYHQLHIATGDDEDNSTECSLNNSLIYTASVPATISYTEVLEMSEGCEWDIEFDDGETLNMKVPSDYAGTEKCCFTSSNVSYNKNDTVDVAVYTLLSGLDFDNNNMSNVNIDDEDLGINALWVPKVPYMWGPSVVEVRTWQ